MECGLLGRKLGHSYSPQIHRHLGSYNYTLFEKEPEQLADFLKNGDFTGLNITIPYKKAVIPYCAALSPIAQKLGAVNTIVRRPDGSLIGHNTDYFGFLSMVQRCGIPVSGKKVLVLGSGGASATAVSVLRELGARVVVISRSGENHYNNLSLHADASLIVNATPVGMYPDVGKAACDIASFPSLEGVLDLIYNPAHTSLLLQAERRGLVAQNGLWMLVAQAKESAEWFTGHPIPDSKIAQIHRALRLETENIILIGMPGSGKTTVGKMLAKRLEKNFVDADDDIVQAAGMSIPDIFAQSSEAGFRAMESAAYRRLGKQSGLVIATGGGCVTRQENYEPLHQNGLIFWLQRDIETLPTQGRPLSQSGKLEQMYEARKPHYSAFSDYVIDNNGDREAAAEAILSILKEDTVL